MQQEKSESIKHTFKLFYPLYLSSPPLIFYNCIKYTNMKLLILGIVLIKMVENAPPRRDKREIFRINFTPLDLKNEIIRNKGQVNDLFKKAMDQRKELTRRMYELRSKYLYLTNLKDHFKENKMAFLRDNEFPELEKKYQESSQSFDQVDRDMFEVTKVLKKLRNVLDRISFYFAAHVRPVIEDVTMSIQQAEVQMSREDINNLIEAKVSANRLGLDEIRELNSIYEKLVDYLFEKTNLPPNDIFNKSIRLSNHLIIFTRKLNEIFAVNTKDMTQDQMKPINEVISKKIKEKMDQELALEEQRTKKIVEDKYKKTVGPILGGAVNLKLLEESVDDEQAPNQQNQTEDPENFDSFVFVRHDEVLTQERHTLFQEAQVRQPEPGVNEGASTSGLQAAVPEQPANGEPEAREPEHPETNGESSSQLPNEGASNQQPANQEDPESTDDEFFSLPATPENMQGRQRRESEGQNQDSMADQFNSVRSTLEAEGTQQPTNQAETEASQSESPATDGAPVSGPHQSDIDDEQPNDTGDDTEGSETDHVSSISSVIENPQNRQLEKPEQETQPPVSEGPFNSELIAEALVDEKPSEPKEESEDSDDQEAYTVLFEDGREEKIKAPPKKEPEPPVLGKEVNLEMLKEAIKDEAKQDSTKEPETKEKPLDSTKEPETKEKPLDSTKKPETKEKPSDKHLKEAAKKEDSSESKGIKIRILRLEYKTSGFKMASLFLLALSVLLV